MQTVLWSIIFILVVLLGIFGLCLWCYKRQISHVISELSSIEKEDTNYRLTSACPIGKTDEMITSMNRVIEKHRTEENALKRENKIYKELLSVAFILSAGILSAVSFFRMYIMAMCWVTVLVYLYIREVERKQFRTQFFVATYVVTLLGALTHYYCIVFAVLISIVYSIYLLVHKMWKKVIAFCVISLMFVPFSSLNIS